MDDDDIVHERLCKEAERQGETVEAAQKRLLTLGLDAAKDRRARDAQASAVQVDVLLVTATRTEFEELRSAAAFLGLPFEKRPGAFGAYYHLGPTGTNRVASMQVPSMGAFGAQGSAARCIQARAETRATTLILVGTAFGVSPRLQRMGDVLVSESVFLYDDRRVVDDDGRLAASVEDLARRADRATSSRWALSRTARRLMGPGYALRYDSARRWASVTWANRFRLLAAKYEKSGETERVLVGTLLSGGARIESERFREDLLGSLPKMDAPVIGGEMEAAGAIAASTVGDSDEPGWIVVKGISDFAEAASRREDELKKNRVHAARSAARAVLRVLLSP